MILLLISVGKSNTVESRYIVFTGLFKNVYNNGSPLYREIVHSNPNHKLINTDTVIDAYDTDVTPVFMRMVYYSNRGNALWTL